MLSPTEIEEAVRYTQRFFTSTEFTSSEPAERVNAAFEAVARDFKNMAKRLRPLSSTERAVVSLTKPKTAALLADRVWSTDSSADVSIAFGWAASMEARFRALLAVHHLFERASGAPSSEPVSPAEVDHFVVGLERDLAYEFQHVTGASVLPLYSSADRRDAQYGVGDHAAIVSIVDNLDIVDEEELTWPQIVEFRRDKAARTAYRRFVHWLDSEMVDRPVEFIEDEVAQRLERYEWALRSHGIRTVIGAISSTLDPKSLVATSTSSLAVGLITGMPIWSLVTAGGVAIGRATVSMASVLIERRDLKMAHPEVAYVQEITKRFCR